MPVAPVVTTKLQPVVRGVERVDQVPLPIDLGQGRPGAGREVSVALPGAMGLRKMVELSLVRGVPDVQLDIVGQERLHECVILCALTFAIPALYEETLVPVHAPSTRIGRIEGERRRAIDA